MPEARPADGPVSPLLVAIALVLAMLTANAAVAVDAVARETFVALSLAHGLAFLGGAWWVLNRRAATADLAFILAVALLLRMLAMTSGPGLTTDVYRYVWDGRLTLAGISPYLHVPADAHLAALRDAAVFPQINQKETAFTIYPPAAQAVFALGASLDLVVGTARDAGHNGMKAVMLLAEGVIVLALLRWLDAARLPRERVLIYAWHPLSIWELAAQAHIDAAALALLVLAIGAAIRGRQGAMGAWLAAATLVKYFAIVLAPALWRRGDWRAVAAFVLVAAVLYLPHLLIAGPKVIGFLGSHLDNEGYAAGWGFHPVWLLREYRLGDMSGRTYAVLAMGLLAILALKTLLARRADEIRPRDLVLLAASFIWLTSAHYPWYFAWALPLLVIAPSPAVLAMTLTCVTLHLPRPPGGITWTEIYAATYWLPLLLLVALSLRARLGGTGRQAR